MRTHRHDLTLDHISPPSWTALSKSTDQLSVSSSVCKLVRVQPDSGVADPWATVTWPGTKVTCGLSLSLTDCAFMLKNYNSCIFELPDCFLAVWPPVRAVLWVDAESGWLHLALFHVFLEGIFITPDRATLWTGTNRKLSTKCLLRDAIVWHALDMALDIIRRTRSKDYVVFSDSLSSLQAIESCKVENPLILKILKDHNQLINSGKSITFRWIPSHIGIRGNEDADIAARQDWMSPSPTWDFQLAICQLVSTNCVLKNGKNCGTSVHRINFTVCNRSLVAVSVHHWTAMTQSLSTVFELVIQDLQTLIS